MSAKSIGVLLDEAMLKHPQLRAGQLLYNLIEASDYRWQKEHGRIMDGIEFRQMFHKRLFYITDTELRAILSQCYLESQAQPKSMEAGTK